MKPISKMHCNWRHTILDFWPIFNMPIFYNSFGNNWHWYQNICIFFPTPNCRNNQVSYYTYSLPCCPAGKGRHKIQSLKLCNIYSLCKRRKILEFMLSKTFHTYLRQWLLNKTSRVILLQTGWRSPWDNHNKTHNQGKFGLFHKWQSVNMTSVHREHGEHGVGSGV